MPSKKKQRRQAKAAASKANGAAPPEPPLEQLAVRFAPEEQELLAMLHAKVAQKRALAERAVADANEAAQVLNATLQMLGKRYKVKPSDPAEYRVSQDYSGFVRIPPAVAVLPGKE